MADLTKTNSFEWTIPDVSDLFRYNLSPEVLVYGYKCNLSYMSKDIYFGRLVLISLLNYHGNELSFSYALSLIDINGKKCFTTKGWTRLCDETLLVAVPKSTLQDQFPPNHQITIRLSWDMNEECKEFIENQKKSEQEETGRFIQTHERETQTDVSKPLPTRNTSTNTGYLSDQPQAISVLNQAGYSLQHYYPPNFQLLQSNPSYNMVKQVPAYQLGMCLNSNGIQSSQQHQNQSQMIGSTLSPLPQTLVKKAEQSTSQNLIPSDVNQQTQQITSQLSHTVQYPMATTAINLQMAAQKYQIPSQYSMIKPIPNLLVYDDNFMKNFNKPPPPITKGYFTNVPSQMPLASQNQQSVKKHLSIIDPNTGKNILKSVNYDTENSSQKNRNLIIMNDAYKSKITTESAETISDMEIQDTKVYDAMGEMISCEKDKKNDISLSKKEITVAETVSDCKILDAAEPSVPLVSEVFTTKETPEIVSMVSECNLNDEGNKIKLTHSTDLQSAVSRKMSQENFPPSEIKRIGICKEGGDMDRYLDRNETASFETSPATASSVTRHVEQCSPTSVPTITDSEITGSVPPPEKAVESIPNTASVNEQILNEGVTPVPHSPKSKANNEISKNQSTVLLRYTYKENQWSPLNPEGKKKYDRDFLLQLQLNPMSLSKPNNLPNLVIVKDKAHIQKLREVRSYDSLMSNKTRELTPTPLRPSKTRRKQKTQKLRENLRDLGFA